MGKNRAKVFLGLMAAVVCCSCARQDYCKSLEPFVELVEEVADASVQGIAGMRVGEIPPSTADLEAAFPGKPTSEDQNSRLLYLKGKEVIAAYKSLRKAIKKSRGAGRVAGEALRVGNMRIAQRHLSKARELLENAPEELDRVTREFLDMYRVARNGVDLVEWQRTEPPEPKQPDKGGYSREKP